MLCAELYINICAGMNYNYLIKPQGGKIMKIAFIGAGKPAVYDKLRQGSALLSGLKECEFALMEH